VVSDLSYRVDGLDSLEGQNELTKQDLTRADLEQAITVYERAEMTRNPHRHQRGRRVRIEPRGLDPDQPDAFAEPLIVIPWVQILEMLCRLPEGGTGRLTSKRRC
jgi:hypothetical protein